MNSCIACGNDKGHNQSYCSRKCYAAHRMKNRKVLPTTKVCGACNRELSMDEYPTDNSRWDHKYPYCKDCANAKSRSRNHAVRLQRHGLSSNEYDTLLDLQNGICAICDRPSKLHIDHDHATGKVRGLLCRSCNHGLGNFKDDTTILVSAIKYLNNNREGNNDVNTTD